MLLKHRKYLTAIFEAGILNALLVTGISSVVIAVGNAIPYGGNGVRPGVWEMAKAAVLLSAITVVSFGSLGFLVGVAGSTWMCVRRQRIRTVKRYLMESAKAGLVLGLLFPFIDVLVNLPAKVGNPLEALLGAPFGVVCGLICSMVFRRRFFAPSI